jgi:hypothetical protein
MMIVRDFRANFQNLAEPVQVLRSRGDVRILGTWYPEERVTNSTAVRYAADQIDSETPERSGTGASLP